MITPNSIFDKLRNLAKTKKRSIVFPEGEDLRVIHAAEEIVCEGIANPILLGDSLVIEEVARSRSIKIADITTIIDYQQFGDYRDLFTLFLDTYREKGKIQNLHTLHKNLGNPLYFSALLVKGGHCDGCVAGVGNTTADVLRAAFSILGTKPGIQSVSGAFLMEVNDQLMVFADCAVVVEPSVEQLADIAIASANTARDLLGLEPKVAMLSFSTHGSGAHPVSDKIKQATALVQSRQPDLDIDGELQVDAAINPVAAIFKSVDGCVAGKANVLIFPDLNSGNIGYKLVQHLAHATAIGPILQGLAKPMNDLSRSASIDDIITMAAITALQ